MLGELWGGLKPCLANSADNVLHLSFGDCEGSAGRLQYVFGPLVAPGPQCAHLCIIFGQRVGEVANWTVFSRQVYVEYANSSDSKEAQRLLMGRTFDGKFVVATFYPLSAYKRGYLYQIVQ